MIKKLKSLIGIKEYAVEITWDNGEKEVVPMNAWSSMNAITKVKKMRDVVNKAELGILDQPRFGRIKYHESESLGIAQKKDES